MELRCPDDIVVFPMKQELFDFFQWPHALFFVEALLVLATPALHYRPGRAERALRRFARHRLSPLAVGAFALVLRAVVLPVEPVPSPSVHDEFSYLLGADTFTHGRLANPTHPMWQHFETMHEDQIPKYASIYPPLQGLVLAAGQVVTGSPFAAVWLSAGVMCAAICWALRGWFSPEWALLAGAIAAMRLATFSYWGDSYWGGALAATGGALIFGALPRLLRASRRRDAFLAGLGVAILANTRPYEGLVFSVAVALIALPRAGKLRLRTVLPPACAVLLCAGVLMAYYNWSVYGSATTMPYTVHRHTYGAAQVFILQPPPSPVTYRHPEMQEFYAVWERGIYDSARTWSGFLLNSVGKLYAWWSFFIGPVLTLPLLACFATLRSRRSRTLLFLIAVAAVASAQITFFQPHYIAAATVVFYAAIVQGMRALNRWIPQAVRAIPLICVLMIGLRVALALTSLPQDRRFPETWARSSGMPIVREALIDQILEDGGQHLVIVHYSAGHTIHAEYVYNAADIDASPIVWARDMGVEKNEELLRYFSSRKVWWLNVGSETRLTEYGAK